MAVVNLGLKYQKNIYQRFTLASILQGRLENDLDFVGARTVRIHTIGTVPINDYSRTASGNRYGTPQEVGDTVQELPMTQDKSFTGIIDRGNNMDQAINKAGKFLRVQLDEEMVPFKDKYGFNVLAKKGGVIVGSGTAITTTNVISRLSAGRRSLVNNKVPVPGRTLYITPIIFNLLAETPQFTGLEKMGNEALINGQIGRLFGSPVVEVPEDYLPAGLNFLWVHKRAASSPAKISDTKLHTDPPGISGSLVEGRFYWDTFVFGARANGIYADVTTGAGATVLGAVTINTGTGVITGITAGATCYYTLDGTDPRFSITAQVTAGPTGAVAGQTVKAYQVNPTNSTVYPSPVASAVIV